MLGSTRIERTRLHAVGCGFRKLDVPGRLGGPLGGWLLRGLDFAPLPGEITIVTESTPGLGSIVLEALGGLRTPDAGIVRVGSRAWGEIASDEANELRGAINWSFRVPVWIESISLSEGITLEERYHTGRATGEVEEEASELCEWFGLPGLPLMKPTDASPGDLRRAELARAFLGDPIAVFLEEALGDAPDDVVASTIEAMQRAAGRGAAVVYAAPSSGEARLAGVRAHRLQLTPEGILEPEGVSIGDGRRGHGTSGGGVGCVGGGGS